MDIYVKNKSFEQVGIVDVFESLVWTDRYDSYGDFELYTKVSPELLALLKEDYYLSIQASEYSMIIESVEVKTDVENGDKLVVKGRDLSSILDRRLIFQTTVLDTTVQLGVQQILNENVINAVSQPQRNIPGFIFNWNSDPIVEAPTIKAVYYTQGVYDTIAYLSQVNNLGFRVTFDSSMNFVFQLYAGKDRSYEQSTNSYVVFSPEFDNLNNSDYFRDSRFKKTIALISGDAYQEGARPTFDYDPWENEPTDPHYPTIRTGLERRELFVDAPDLSTIDPGTGLPFEFWTYVYIMYNRARQALNENISYELFNGEANVNGIFKYGVDFFLGDIVQMADKYGHTGRARVTEMIISENLSGYSAYPTFSMI